MKNLILSLTIAIISLSVSAQEFPKDIFSTSQGDLTITFIGHASLMFIWNDMVIYADPVMREADFTQFPDADVIMITHQHGDHLDVNAIKALMKDNTWIIMTEACAEQLSSLSVPKKSVITAWDEVGYNDLECQAVPAYNIEHKRSNGEPFHPKGVGNGYLVKFGDFKVLIGGDTENIPEYKELADDDIDVAFLPMNLPYTMTPEQVAEAAKVIRPKILYPYHYGNTDTDKLLELMRDEKDIEVRVRPF